MDMRFEAYESGKIQGQIKAKFNVTRKSFENNDNRYKNKEKNIAELHKSFSEFNGVEDNRVKKFLDKAEKLERLDAYLEGKNQKIARLEDTIKNYHTKLEGNYADLYQSLIAKTNTSDNQEPLSMQLDKAFKDLCQERNDDPNLQKFSEKVGKLVSQYEYHDKLQKKILEIKNFAENDRQKLRDKYPDLYEKLEENKDSKSFLQQFKEKFRPILDFFKRLGEKLKPCWEYLTRNRKSVDQSPNDRDASAHNHDTQTRKSPERSSTSDHSPKKRNKALRLLLKALKYLKGYPKRFGRAIVHEWDHHKKRGTALVIATVAGSFVPGVAAIAPFILPGYYGYRTATYNHYKEMSKKYGKPAEQSAKRKLVHAATGTEIYIPEKKRSREISYLIRHEAKKLKGEGKLDKNDIELFKLKKKQVSGLLDEKNPTPIEGWKVEPNEFSKPATKQEVEDLHSKILQLEDSLRERDTNQ